MVTWLRDGGPPPEFLKALDLLEGRGVTLLVVGEADDDAMQTLLRRILGDPAEDRYRVLTLLNDDDPARYLPRGVTSDREDVRVLRYPAGRSTAVDSRPTDPAGSAGSAVPEDGVPCSLTEVGRHLRSTCDDLARLASERDARSSTEFEPGELRVAVDSLQPLIDAVGVDRVVEWLGVDVIPEFRDPLVQGRSHWVYYGPHDDAIVEDLMADPGLFDVLVRVRRRHRLVEHQWVLRPDRFPHLASRLESPWMIAEP